MQKMYRDRDWLYMMYRIKKLSIPQIAESTAMSLTTIWRWLQKFNIPIRSRGEGIHLTSGNHCKLSQKAREWIDGELLGDGCLQSRSPHSAQFKYSSKYLEYIQYVSETLASFGIKQVGEINERYYNYKNMNYYACKYNSRDYAELLSIRKRWYPERKKIIPRDLKLTPLTLRQHFIGDGSLIHHKNRRPYIILYTNGFSIDDVEWLKEQLTTLGFKATRQPSCNAINISVYSTQDLLNYIGESPVKCYQYKWAY